MASFGAGLKRRQKLFSCSILFSNSAGLRLSETLLRGMWVVASNVLKRQPLWGERAVNNIAAAFALQSSAKRSVCPG